MAYQNIGRPKFYIDRLSKLLANGAINETAYEGFASTDYKYHSYPGLFGLTPDETHTVGPEVQWISFDIPTGFNTDSPINNAATGRIAYAAVLGHNLKSNQAKISTEWHDGNGNKDFPQESGVVNYGVEDNYPVADGFSLCTLTDDPSDADRSRFLRIVLKKDNSTWSADLNALSFGFVYQMPHSPELSVKMTREADGITSIRTIGGADLVNKKYSKPPLWNTLAPWELHAPETIYHDAIPEIPAEEGWAPSWIDPMAGEGTNGSYHYMIANYTIPASEINNVTAQDGGPGDLGTNNDYEYYNNWDNQFAAGWPGAAPFSNEMGNGTFSFYRAAAWNGGGYNASMGYSFGYYHRWHGALVTNADYGIYEGETIRLTVNHPNLSGFDNFTGGEEPFQTELFHWEGEEPIMIGGQTGVDAWWETIYNPPSQGASRSGRRIWELEFKYLSNSEIFPDQSSLTNYGTSGWSEGASATDNTLLDENTFVSQVLQGTNGGQLPFIFQPDGNNNNPDQFAIAKFDMDAIKFTQEANGVYNVKLKIREVW